MGTHEQPFVVEASQPLIAVLKGRMRAIDERTCRDTISVGAGAGLQWSFDASPVSWVCLDPTGSPDDEPQPVFAWGAASLSVLQYKGIPWFMGSDRIGALGLRILRQSSRYLALLFEHFDFLENMVDNRHQKSVAWLRWCGFHMSEPQPHGDNNIPCRRFWLARKEF